MEENGVNYYKGVLLCSRPNENASADREKVFCARVVPKEKLGLPPAKVYDVHVTRKRVLPVLNNHKKWLEKFKKSIVYKKTTYELEKEKEIARLEKIKYEGKKIRYTLSKGEQIAYEKISKVESQPQEGGKEDAVQNKSAAASQNVPKGNPTNMSKKKKPFWAMTAQQAYYAEYYYVDNLLNFFQNGENIELKDFLSDYYVRNIVVELKRKIEKIKEKYRKKGIQYSNAEYANKATNDEKGHKDSDLLSQISNRSDSHSVASQKTIYRVQYLYQKKYNKYWDNLTHSDKRSMASTDEQIAKNIADYVLRNYPALKHHSNQSIRKLLEKQARYQMKAYIKPLTEGHTYVKGQTTSS